MKNSTLNTENIRTIKTEIRDWLSSQIKLNNSEVQIMDVSNPKFGDYSTNIAMIIAGKDKSNPKKIAQKFANNLNSKLPDYIEKVETAGPGFINIYLAESYLKNTLKDILISGDDYGKYDLGKKRQIMLEFGQANTHKVVHIGHIRNYISAQSLINIFSNFNFEVIKANYFGDVGMHIAKALWGIQHLEFPENIESKSPDEKMDFLQRGYVLGASKFKEDKKAENEIREINTLIYSKEDKNLNDLYDQTRQWSLEHQKQIFDIMGISYDVEYPESQIAPIGREIVMNNIPKVFKKDNGAIIFEGEKYGLHNRVFISSEGNTTYEGKDMGLAITKFKDYKNLYRAYNLVANEQSEYFKVIFKALEKINSDIANKLFHIEFGLLLIKGKKESSRSGITMTGKELLEKMQAIAMEKIGKKGDFTQKEKENIAKTVGIGSLRYMILSHPLHVNISFDPDQAISIEGNSAPYLMYTYARAKSIIKRAGVDIEALKAIDGIEIITKEEHQLARKLAKYQEVLINSLDKFSPHIIANYIYELSTIYNTFYKKYPVLNVNDPSILRSRLILSYTTAQVIKNGLATLGIETLERM